MRVIMINKHMKHIIYKTTHTNGKYYIGRHSTDNIDDGYIGSGMWVSQIKDKSTLSREVIVEAITIDELIVLEEKYIAEHISNELCMNMSNASTGFATGELNPMRNPESVKKISGENHWLSKNPTRKKEISNRQKDAVLQGKHNFAGENNPVKKPENRKAASERLTHRNLTDNPSTRLSAEGKHHWQDGKSPNAGGKLNKKLIEEGRHNFGTEFNNRMVAEGKNPWVGPAGNLKMLAEGNHPSQIKMTCEHCNKTVSKGMYARWHGDKCKSTVD